MTRRLTAAERIQKRAAQLVLRGWCKGHMAETEGGFVCAALDPEAAKWCMAGALVRAAGGPEERGLTAARYAVYARFPKRWDGEIDMTEANDYRVRTRQQAAELLWPGSSKGAK